MIGRLELEVSGVFCILDKVAVSWVGIPELRIPDFSFPGMIIGIFFFTILDAPATGGRRVRFWITKISTKKIERLRRADIA
jgi:hypothetical protein